MSKRKQVTALTTGQAARYCFVTPDTILNWINAGIIDAQQTAGGRYRILVKDLRRFMHDRQMSTEALDADLSERPYCWQFHGSNPKHHRGELGSCKTCIIHKSQTFNCYVLKGFLPMLHCSIEDCQECEYYKRYIAGNESRQEEVS